MNFLIRPNAEKLLAEDYEQRIRALGRKAGVSGVVVQDWAESGLATADLRRADEAKRLWSGVTAGSCVIVLDERGMAMGSAEFSKLIARETENATKTLAFMIGGPDGHVAESRHKAHKTMSFGPMTFPHRLLRVMLLEQIYRSVTLLLNHPYHRS